MISRRSMLGSSLLLPLARAARGGSLTAERKLLVVCCEGGWDPTYVFAPLFDAPNVDMEPDAEVGEVNGLTFVDHASRPTVRAFFEVYGDRVAFLNGLESPSITHDRCMKLLLTGSADAGVDDWAALIAASSSNDLVLPSVVLSGFSFTSALSAEVVRVGPSGQLKRLIEGTAITTSVDSPVALPSAAAQDAVARYVANRIARVGAGATPGDRTERFAAGYARSLSQVGAVLGEAEALGLSGLGDLEGMEDYGDFANAVNLLASGSVRCVSLGFRGLFSLGWDTHSFNSFQTEHFEALFTYLTRLMEALDSTASPTAARLSDEVTVLVCSEMGRGPLLNGTGGKDHFPFTSAMLLGAGVAGGQVVGGFDGSGIGLPIDFATGQAASGGGIPHTRDLGATLLSLMGADSALAPAGAAPIEALIT